MVVVGRAVLDRRSEHKVAQVNVPGVARDMAVAPGVAVDTTARDMGIVLAPERRAADRLAAGRTWAAVVAAEVGMEFAADMAKLPTVASVWRMDPDRPVVVAVAAEVVAAIPDQDSEDIDLVAYWV